MIRVKQIFRNKSALKEAVCLWALSSMREFWVKVSSQDKYTVYCKKFGSQFRVRAYKPKYETHFEASYYNLPRVLEVIKQNNPRTYTAFKESEIDANNVTKFHRAFFSLGTCT